MEKYQCNKCKEIYVDDEEALRCHPNVTAIECGDAYDYGRSEGLRKAIELLVGYRTPHTPLASRAFED